MVELTGRRSCCWWWCVQVVKGLDRCLGKVGVGSRSKVTVKPPYAYGDAGESSSSSRRRQGSEAREQDLPVLAQ